MYFLMILQTCRVASPTLKSLFLHTPFSRVHLSNTTVTINSMATFQLDVPWPRLWYFAWWMLFFKWSFHNYYLISYTCAFNMSEGLLFWFFSRSRSSFTLLVSYCYLMGHTSASKRWCQKVVDQLEQMLTAGLWQDAQFTITASRLTFCLANTYMYMAHYLHW